MNQYVEEMRQYYKTKREFGARTEGCVAKIEGVGDVRREELEEWESMTKRRSSDFNNILARHSVDIGKALAEFREDPPEDMTSLLKNITPTTACPTAPLYRKDSESTTGIQNLDAEEKALLRNKSHTSGTSSPCSKRLSMLTTSFSRTGST